MGMEFIKQWRHIYDEVNRLGAIYKDSLPGYVKNGSKWDKLPPKIMMEKEEQKEIQSTIEELTAFCTVLINTSAIPQKVIPVIVKRPRLPNCS